MTLYEVLGVQSGASLEDIKKAFKENARLYQPDIVKARHRAEGNELNEAEQKEAERIYKELVAAYTTLSSPKERAKYDYELANPTSNHNGFSNDTENRHQNINRKDFFDLGNIFGGSGNPFSDLFGSPNVSNNQKQRSQPDVNRVLEEIKSGVYDNIGLHQFTANNKSFSGPTMLKELRTAFAERLIDSSQGELLNNPVPDYYKIFRVDPKEDPKIIEESINFCKQIYIDKVGKDRNNNRNIDLRNALFKASSAFPARVAYDYTLGKFKQIENGKYDRIGSLEYIKEITEKGNPLIGKYMQVREYREALNLAFIKRKMGSGCPPQELAEHLGILNILHDLKANHKIEDLDNIKTMTIPDLGSEKQSVAAIFQGEKLVDIYAIEINPNNKNGIPSTKTFFSHTDQDLNNLFPSQKSRHRVLIDAVHNKLGIKKPLLSRNWRPPHRCIMCESNPEHVFIKDPNGGLRIFKALQNGNKVDLSEVEMKNIVLGKSEYETRFGTNNRGNSEEKNPRRTPFHTQKDYHIK